TNPWHGEPGEAITRHAALRQRASSRGEGRSVVDPLSSNGPLYAYELAAHCLHDPEFQREAVYDGQGDELSDLLALIDAIQGVEAWRLPEEWQFGWDVWTAEFVTELIQADWL